MPTGSEVRLTAAAEHALFLEGIRLFNSHQFFEAHEVWEDVWRESHGVKREFFQGLIQCAVALEHYRRGNPRGVLSLSASYQKHFSHVPPNFMGVDVSRLQQAMGIVLAPVLDAVPPAVRGEIALDLAQVPRLAVEPVP
jgi:hypothetical protein